jgi:hypothetical protein
MRTLQEIFFHQHKAVLLWIFVLLFFGVVILDFFLLGFVLLPLLNMN